MRRLLLVLGVLFIGAWDGMAIEEAAFEVVKRDGDFEIRAYAPHIVAETLVEGTLEDAGNKAFGILFRYISGDNTARSKVAMTAPVKQERSREKIAMTAPVGQERVQEKWAVSFMMPASYTLETLPVPENPNVRLRQVPARRLAAVCYSGTWSEKNYLKHKQALQEWMDGQGLKAGGTPVWARYNPPFMPWFLRRNEILIPLAEEKIPGRAN
jgi:hypothetical protein